MQKICILLLAMIMFSCGRQTTDHDHGLESAEEHTGHEAEIEKTTLYSDDIEYFITNPPLIAGETTEFVVHLTRLEDYKPVKEGRMTVILLGDQGKLSGVSDKAVEPGIFHVSLAPELAGEYKLTVSLEQNGFQDKMTAEGFRVWTSDADHDSHHDHDIGTGLITFPKVQAWNSQFMIQRVVHADFEGVIRAGGEILAMPGEKKVISATTGGIIVFPVKGMVQGSEVKKGDILMAISGEDMVDGNVRLKFNEAANNFEQSRNIYERHRLLIQEKVISEKEFQSSRNRYLNDSARYFALKSSFGSGGMIIRAPVTGYIHELDVSEGEYVTAGQTLATVSANKIMLLRADLPQQYFSELGLIETANFRPAYSHDVFSISQLNGHLMARGFSVAENNHYMPVYFEVVNDGSLLEGAFAEFYLKTSQKEAGLIIPSSAVTEEIGNYYVYVQKDGEHYEKRLIEPGADDGNYTAVKHGLEEGERVVTSGAMLVKAASLASGIPVHSHEH